MRRSLPAVLKRTGRWLETTVLVVLVTSMISVAVGQIVLRNTTGAGFPWADEFLRLNVLWIAMVGAVAAAREYRHITIDLAGRLLARVPRLLLFLVLDLFSAVVCLVLAWECLALVRGAREYGDIVMDGVPAWIAQAVMPVAFAAMGWHYLVWWSRRARALITGQEDT